MEKKRWLSLLMALILTATAAAPVKAAEDAAADDAETQVETSDAETPASGEDSGTDAPEGETAISKIPLSGETHVAYVSGSAGELPAFHPYRAITRAELSQLLFRLLAGTLDSETYAAASYPDVPEEAWYAQAVRTMGALGVIPTDAEGRILPGQEVSRGDFARYVAAFFPLRTDAELFADVRSTDENAPYIRSARAYGWIQGEENGNFIPDRPVTRTEAVVILNRALKRIPDRSYIDSNRPAVYVDVSPDSWFYYDVMEASVAHEHTVSGDAEVWTAHTAKTNPPTSGFYSVDGWLYCYDSEKGDIVRNEQRGTFTFDANGRYTSGSEELDWKLRGIVNARTNSKMTQEEKLRALYIYTRDSFTYLRRKAYAFGATGFMQEDALNLLNTGYGNCYSYASLFWYLSRWIGYDSVIYSGTVGSNRAPHSWVEINLDGRDYIFDTELEMAYHRKGRYDINLYKLPAKGNSWQYVRP